MRLRHPVWLLFLGMGASALAVEKPYQAGKIIGAQEKVNTRVLYYLVNTPVTEDDPYYQVSVQVGNTIYRGIHTPRHGDSLPESWKPNTDVEVRIEGRRFYLRRPSGEEMDFAVAKRTTAKSAP